MPAPEGLIAWVDRADEEPGHAVALVLASRRVRVLVSGARERALGECVGEIAHGGGRGRHFVSTASTDEGARACVGACVERFGAPFLAFVDEADELNARRALPAGTRIVVLPAAPGDDCERRARDLVEAALAAT